MRNSTFIIGLTGTIGSGKSFVAEVLADNGAEIIDTDLIAREVVAPGTEGLARISERWGGSVLNEDGTLNREALASIVFKNDAERTWLNQLLHPLIGHETATRLGSSDADITVLVVPLLFESGMDATVDQSWLVVADEATLLDRICSRDSCTREAAEARIRTQMPQDEKRKRADVVIDNSETKEITKMKVLEAMARIEKS